MNLVHHSLHTKGLHNFVRRLWTVFARFGFSESKIERALSEVIDSLRQYQGAPTFFIPAVVLNRHFSLIANISNQGAEIGIHGYVHNDYRYLNETEQLKQTKQAISVFRTTQTPYQGFRNPYLGWTEESLRVFNKLDFAYESNEAVLHDVIDLEQFPPAIREGYQKSRVLYRVLPANAYTLRPHFENGLLRIPTSVPDDEMLFDRLRITACEAVGSIWSKVMQHVYAYEGVYVLNLHPERGVLCKQALDILLSYAHRQPRSVWLTRLDEIAQWWKERNQFTLQIIPLSANRWSVEASCTSRATLMARHLTLIGENTAQKITDEQALHTHSCIVEAQQFPCIGLSERTALQVQDFLCEQGYPSLYCLQEDAAKYALYLDLPAGLGTTREEQLQQCSSLIQQIKDLQVPFIRFACWPNGHQAALSITGDIDSVTVQDFFLRIFEVSKM